MKNKTNFKLAQVFFLIVTLLLISCAGNPSSKGAPVWMTDLNRVYPDANYLAAVGSGDNRQKAQEAASGMLAQYFRVSVSVDLVSQERYLDIVKGDAAYSESEKNITQTIGTQANEQFVNLRYSDPYTDASGMTHVVAFLERLPTANAYRTIIDKDQAKINDLMTRGAGMTGAFRRYAFFDAANSVGQNIERMIAQLQIIHQPSARIAEMGFDLTPVIAARDKELSGLTYDINLSGDPSGRMTGIIKNIFSELSLSYKEGGDLNVTGSWFT